MGTREGSSERLERDDVLVCNGFNKGRTTGVDPLGGQVKDRTGEPGINLAWPYRLSSVSRCCSVLIKSLTGFFSNTNSPDKSISMGYSTRIILVFPSVLEKKKGARHGLEQDIQICTPLHCLPQQTAQRMSAPGQIPPFHVQTLPCPQIRLALIRQTTGHVVGGNLPAQTYRPVAAFTDLCLFI